MRVRIECEGKDTSDIKDLVPFQGKLKSLSDRAYEGLKSLILELGYSDPINVWYHEGKKFILDGHQRLRTLTKMRSEGIEIPPVPICIIHAKTYAEAKRKCLGMAAGFGEVERDGLYEFLSDAEIQPEELDAYRFPDVDVDHFRAEFYDGWQTDIPDPSGGPPNTDGIEAVVKVRCPQEHKEAVSKAIVAFCKEQLAHLDVEVD